MAAAAALARMEVKAKAKLPPSQEAIKNQGRSSLEDTEPGQGLAGTGAECHGNGVTLSCGLLGPGRRSLAQGRAAPSEGSESC